MEDSGSLWSSLGPNMVPAVGNMGSCQAVGGLGTGVSYQDSLRRCSQRKKSDIFLLGCASLLASVGLGQDLLQLGKQQVGNPETGRDMVELWSKIKTMLHEEGAFSSFDIWIFILFAAFRE